MKRERDYQKEVQQRKFKKTNWFWYFLYYVIMHIFVSRKYRPHYEIVDDINDCKTGCFLIWNHLSRIDHLYVMRAAFPRRINIVAAWSEFFRSHLHWVFKMNNIIPKKQYTNDMKTIKGMASILNQNGVVAFAPEGIQSHYGTNQPIIAGTGHLLKHFKVPVYYVEMRGQYLTTHKTCLDERKGDTYAKMMLLLSTEDIERMTEQEIDDKINLTFKHDEYEWQKEKHIKWKTNGRICHNFSDMLYKCPKCNQEFKMISSGNQIKCENCGNSATMNDYYEFEPFDESIIPESPSKWAIWERKQVIDDIRKDPNYSFSTHVKIGTIPKNVLIKNYGTSIICGEGNVTVDHEGFHFTGIKNNEPYSFDLDYQTLYTLILEQDFSLFSLYIKGEYHDFIPDTRCSFKLLLIVEEMHRLHVNTWKNFPWLDYLYQEY